MEDTDGDGDLTDDNSDLLTLAATGEYKVVVHTVCAMVTPGTNSSGDVININGTVYYVRTSGDDGGDGLSPSTAWITIAKAEQSMSPGDGVYIGAVTYNEDVTVNASGTSDDPIWYVADTDGAKTGDSGTVIVDGSSSNPAFHVDGANHIRLIAINFENSERASFGKVRPGELFETARWPITTTTVSKSKTRTT